MKHILPFKLARRMSRESGASLGMSFSDCDSLTLDQLLSLADNETRGIWDNLSLGYTSTQGDSRLRAEIAKRYNDISSDHVLVCAPQEGIFLACVALLNADNSVVATAPAYQPLLQLPLAIRCKTASWLPQEDQGWRFDPEDLDKLVSNHTKLISINFPHNPTGYLPTRDELHQIVRIAENSNAWIFSDEMFRGLESSDSRRLPSAIDIYEKAVIVDGLSKTYGLGGLRVGWIVSRDKALLDRMETLKDYTTSCMSATSETLALIALRAQDAIHRKNINTVQQNVVRANQFFNHWDEYFQWCPPTAGTLAFPRLIKGLSASTDEQQSPSATAFCDWALAKLGISILPSSLYDFGDSHFRLGLGRRSLADAFQHLNDHLEQQT